MCVRARTRLYKLFFPDTGTKRFNATFVNRVCFAINIDYLSVSNANFSSCIRMVRLNYFLFAVCCRHMGPLKSMSYGSLVKAIFKYTMVHQNYGKVLSLDLPNDLPS